MILITDLKALYEIDDQQWLEATIKLLKARRFQELDLDNLIEELEDLGSERRNAVETLLEQIIRHLLMSQYWLEQAQYNQNHWRAEIISFRTQLERRLTTNLRNYLAGRLPKIYQNALKYVRQKTGFTIEFPEQCPYNLEQLLDIDWLP
jgi:hypothetical protein